jgi:hypothetical protein
MEEAESSAEGAVETPHTHPPSLTLHPPCRLTPPFYPPPSTSHLQQQCLLQLLQAAARARRSLHHLHIAAIVLQLKAFIQQLGLDGVGLGLEGRAGAGAGAGAAAGVRARGVEGGGVGVARTALAAI